MLLLLSRPVIFCSEKVDFFLLTVFIYRSVKKPNKKSKEDKKILAELSSAHRRSQAKCQLTTNRLH